MGAANAITNTIIIEPSTSETWSVRRVIATTSVVLAVGLAFVGVLRFYGVLFAFITALTLHIGINPFVVWLKKRSVSPMLATTIAYAVVFLVAAGFLALVFPFIFEQVGTIAERLPTYYAQLRQAALNSGISTLIAFAKGLPTTINLMSMIPSTPLLTSASSATTGAAAPATDASSAAPSPLMTGAFTFIAIFVLAFYWTLNSDRLNYSLVLRIPEARRESARALIVEMEDKVGAFFRGQLILCAFVGVLQLAAYLLIGLPYALVLALIAFVCEAIPMVGPTLGAVPAFIIALAVAPEKAVFVIISTLVIQQVENNILTPRVMDRAVGVTGIVVILSIMGFSVLFGFVGALLAIPLAAILQILLNRALFQTSSAEATPVAADLDTDPQAAGARDHASVLRMEARELAEDVRKQMRKQEAAASLPTLDAPFDDVLEAIALDLDSLLAQRNGSGPALAPAIAVVEVSPVVKTDVIATQARDGQNGNVDDKKSRPTSTH